MTLKMPLAMNGCTMRLLPETGIQGAGQPKAWTQFQDRLPSQGLMSEECDSGMHSV